MSVEHEYYSTYSQTDGWVSSRVTFLTASESESETSTKSFRVVELIILSDDGIKARTQTTFQTFKFDHSEALNRTPRSIFWLSSSPWREVSPRWPPSSASRSLSLPHCLSAARSLRCRPSTKFWQSVRDFFQKFGKKSYHHFLAIFVRLRNKKWFVFVRKFCRS